MCFLYFCCCSLLICNIQRHFIIYQHCILRQYMQRLYLFSCLTLKHIIWHSFPAKALYNWVGVGVYSQPKTWLHNNEGSHTPYTCHNNTKARNKKLSLLQEHILYSHSHGPYTSTTTIYHRTVAGTRPAFQPILYKTASSKHTRLLINPPFHTSPSPHYLFPSVFIVVSGEQ